MSYLAALELKKQFKVMYNAIPVAYYIVTLGASKELQQRELIKQCINHRCVYGFLLRECKVIILCLQHGAYDHEYLENSLGHFLFEFLDADVIKKWYRPDCVPQREQFR